MPQLFQVLKCFKCSVFQVHQTKKANKWECKLCGEKQSIKRHYGLGTGKECRLHVQKLNSIRGEVNEINDIDKLNESSDEEIPEKEDAIVSDKRQTNLKSKWLGFLDKTEDVKVQEPESMYIGNVEVVLEVPAKRRKFTKPQVTKKYFVSTNPTDTNCFDNVQGPETQLSNVKKNPPSSAATTINKNNDDKFCKTTRIITEPQPDVKQKTSKWAQYNSDENNEKDPSSLLSFNENATINNADYIDIKICSIINSDQNPKKPPTQLFSLCNEDDIDEVLNF